MIATSCHGPARIGTHLAPIGTRLQVWEEAYLARLQQARAVELHHQRRFRRLSVTSTALGRASPMVAAALTFIIYSRLYELEAAVIFPALSVFQSLRLPFILLPIIFNNLVSVFVSIRRVSAFLDLPEQPPRGMLLDAAPADANASSGAPAALLSFENASVGWPEAAKSTPQAANPMAKPPANLPHRTAECQSSSAEESQSSNPEPGAPSPAAAVATPAAASFATPAAAASTAATVAIGARAATVLEGVELRVHGGELVALVGQVGSGKTTLLASAWGEAISLVGRLGGPASIGMVPQRAFTITGMLPEITFDLEPISNRDTLPLNLTRASVPDCRHAAGESRDGSRRE